MREIVQGNMTTNALRTVGQFSPFKGVIPTLGGGAAGHLLGLPYVAIPALGVASNRLASFLTARQIETLRTLVAQRSPAYAAAVRKAVNRFENAQREFASRPSPNKFASYLSASRALAGGLQNDGIQIASGDLLKLVQSPTKSAADQEQNPVPGSPGQQENQ